MILKRTITNRRFKAIYVRHNSENYKFSKFKAYCLKNNVDLLEKYPFIYSLVIDVDNKRY